MLARALRVLNNLRLDLRFGRRFLGGTQPTRFAHRGAHDVANSDYRVLPLLFDGRVSPDDVLVDVGCGRGRVLNFWLSKGYRNRLIGIELDPEVAEETRRRLSGYRNIQVLTGDVLALWPADATLFYLFNPFGREIVSAFAARALQSERPLTIIYYNAVHLDVFHHDPHWTVEPVTLPGEFHRAAVIRTSPASVGARP